MDRDHYQRNNGARHQERSRVVYTSFVNNSRTNPKEIQMYPSPAKETEDMRESICPKHPTLDLVVTICLIT